jgi:hypothetical protein
MSRFTPEMDRDGIQWQEPVGTWKQGQDIVHLATIAEKLVIPLDRENTDMLNSIPTPWSRLLLFESALYNAQHPSHADVLDQWRGLLGLLALAQPLGINVRPGSAEHTIRLNDFATEHAIAKTFVDLRPRYEINGEDVEQEKWDQFHLIVVDDSLLGATSSRTLVFTAIDHRCPPTIPFQNAHGRLSDPLRYFNKFKDQKYLALLKRWLDNFITAVEGKRDLIAWLGTLPAPPRVTAPRRHEKLLELLRQWRAEAARALPANAPHPQLGPLTPLFTLSPYNSLVFLPHVPPSDQSDLLLSTEAATQKKVLVCYRPARGQNPKTNSLLYNEHGQVVQSDALLIYDGRWMTADGVLPEKLNFLPADCAYISDPVAELFEEQIIEVELPEAAEDKGSSYALRVGQKAFLFPFKRIILDYFTPAELHQFTSIAVEPDQGYRVTLELPLVNGRSIRATRLYEDGSQELVLINNKTQDHRASEMAMWPGFADEGWNHYFYFKRQVAPKDQPTRNLDFVPLGGGSPRSSSDNVLHWYFSTRPARAFVGSVGGKSGLLLPKYEELEAQTDRDFWNVAVDVGSTHTRVFYLKMQRDEGGNYKSWPEARIEKLEFSAHARQITACDPERLKNDFFALSGKLDPPTRVELKTLLMQPVSDSTKHDDWRPREGFSLMHWIHGGFDDRKLKTDIKWESGGNKNDLNSYLRCLMVMVQAEAALRHADIALVTRSYPTAFNNKLKADHNAVWVALGSFMNMRVESDVSNIISEAVATARFLGSTSAPQTSNTVSLDIGGSTTDIAIWYGKHVRGDHGGPLKTVLGVQESVKLAAGSLGRYLQSDPHAGKFLEWFVQAVKRQGVFKELSLESFAGRRLGYALMFYNILSYYELAGDRLQSEYNALLAQIKVQDEARGLLLHLVYMFGSLIYYAGLLARKVGLQEQKRPVHYLYFCGKGGTLVTWINNHERFAERLFLAGLYGPDAATDESAAGQPQVEGNAPGEWPRTSVVVRISPRPKEEVGRGLLVPLTLREGKEDEGNFGLVDPKPHSVTVAETGYKIRAGETTKELKWSDELDRSVLRSLDGNLPAFHEMKELNSFIKAVSEAYKNQDEDNPLYDFNRLLASDREKHTYIDRLTTRLLGDDEGCVLHDLEQENNPNALIEPLLITEMKVLLEVLTDNDKIFK